MPGTEISKIEDLNNTLEKFNIKNNKNKKFAANTFFDFSYSKTLINDADIAMIEKFDTNALKDEIAALEYFPENEQEHDLLSQQLAKTIELLHSIDYNQTKYKTSCSKPNTTPGDMLIGLTLTAGKLTKAFKKIDKAHDEKRREQGIHPKSAARYTRGLNANRKPVDLAELNQLELRAPLLPKNRP